MRVPGWEGIMLDLRDQLLPFLRCSFQDASFAQCQLDPELNPVVPSFTIMLGFVAYSYIWSVICQNVSKVDQIWSITPGVYCCHLLYLFFARETRREGHGAIPSNYLHQRLALMTALVLLWGVRLTYNFWRRGGYGNLIQHEEDYRWPILRKTMHPILFQMFNLTFIASFQNILLWLIAYPAYVVMMSKDHRIHLLDMVLAALFLFFLAMETIADNQHYMFQTKKHSMTPTERKLHNWKDIQDGFLQSGLFYYSRHPNYFAEQSMWVIFYAFTFNSYLHSPINHSMIGVVLLILLFQGSMAFGESITKSKYPLYENYQLRVPQCFPYPMRSRRDKKNA